LAKLFRHLARCLVCWPAHRRVRLLNRLDVVIKSTICDNRTLAIPVAHTIYFEMGAARRATMGITDSLIRISVGIEDSDDLLADFDNALASGT
jgi:O-acetylhomoserine (thiol)-lyase